MERGRIAQFDAARSMLEKAKTKEAKRRTLLEEQKRNIERELRKLADATASAERVYNGHRNAREALA